MSWHMITPLRATGAEKLWKDIVKERKVGRRGIQDEQLDGGEWMGIAKGKCDGG